MYSFFLSVNLYLRTLPTKGRGYVKGGRGFLKFSPARYARGRVTIKNPPPNFSRSAPEFSVQYTLLFLQCNALKCNVSIRGDLCAGSLFFKDSHIVVEAVTL